MGFVSFWFIPVSHVLSSHRWRAAMTRKDDWVPKDGSHHGMVSSQSKAATIESAYLNLFTLM